MTKYISLGAVLVLSTACLEKIGDTGSSTVEPSNEAAAEPSNEASTEPANETSTEPDPEPIEAFISWTSDGATLNVTNADPTSYMYFGMAQSQDGQYTSPEEAYDGGQWGAEDCTGLWGGDDYCHEVFGPDETGYAFIEFTSVAAPADVTASGEEQFTLFADPSPGADTYVLDVNGEACYVWGVTPAYYDVWLDLYGYSCEYMPEWN